MQRRKRPVAKKSTTEQFEEALANRDERIYELRLFVSGITPRSLEAIEQVRALCEEHLKGRYRLEVIDLYKDPQAAKDEQVVAAPTLVKMLPAPMRKIIGNMAKNDRLLAGLDIRVQNGK